VVVITGASRGIGRAVAEAAAARGAHLGLLARSADELAELQRALSDQTRVAVAVADVADPPAVRAALTSLEAELGSIDALVANAGIGQYGAFVDIEPEELERLVRVNVLGVMHTIQAVAPGMIARRRGSIVTIASIAGRVGVPFEALYSATKFAVVGLTEALAVELHPYGISVSMVNPGPVDTDFFEARGAAYARPRPKAVPVSDVVDAVMALLDSGRLERHVPRWLGGSVVVRHVLPPLLSWGTRQSFRKELAEDVEKRS
jgi:3-oxoacyl-[acyl-carrier protein] reductase